MGMTAGFHADWQSGSEKDRDLQDDGDAGALIKRALCMLENAGNMSAALHLHDALDALQGKPSRQADHNSAVHLELRHRFRNMVAVTQSLVNQTLRPGTSMEQASERLTERLAAMSTAIDLLVNAEWKPNPLDTVVRASLAHYANHSERMRCQGPEVMVGSNAMISLTLALHELETNAIKHGALSVPEGRVDLAWSLVGSEIEPKLWLQWCEHGGPEVSPPQRQGFGTRLISTLIGRFLSADVQLEYTPNGVTWLLIAPLAVIRT